MRVYTNFPSYNMLCELCVSLIMRVFAAFHRSTHDIAWNHTQTCPFTCRHQRRPNAAKTADALEILSTTLWDSWKVNSFTEDYRNAHISKQYLKCALKKS